MPPSLGNKEFKMGKLGKIKKVKIVEAKNEYMKSR
jgi:hypothetical protein